MCMTRRMVPQIRFPGAFNEKGEWVAFTDDWEQRKFGDIALRESLSKESSDDYPFVEYEDVIAEEGRLNKDIRQKEGSKKGIVFDGSQVLYGKLRPYLHNWLNPDFSGVAVGDWWVLKPQHADKNFVYRLIQTQQFDDVANQSAGSKMPRADWNLVSNTEYAIPASLEEQEKIGEYFDNLDNLITLHQRKCDTYKKMKEAVMAKLFSQQIRFKKDDGTDYADWEEKILGECCTKCQSGGTPKSDKADYYNGPYKFLSITDMTNAGKYLTDTAKTITNAGLENSSAWLVPANTLLLSMYASFGKVGISTVEMATSQAIIALILKPEYDLEFMYQLLNLFDMNGAWRSATNDSVQKNLSRGLVMAKSITIPTDLEEQTKIANCLSAYDALIDASRRKVEAVKRLKKAMLQKMFV